MIASLVMYARPELEKSHARLWTLIRNSLATRGVDAPPALSQAAPLFDVWNDPLLTLSQTCGMPYRTQLKDTVQLVASPDYGLEGCPAGYYRSAIVVRADDPRGNLADYATARLAYNAAHSQSGFAALYNHVLPLGFWFADRIASGGHLASAQMVSNGKADIAALDAQTWRLIERFESVAAHLRVLECTAPTPGLPYITGAQNSPDTVFAAFTEALNALDAQDKTALDLQGLVRISSAEYLAVPNPPIEASA